MKASINGKSYDIELVSKEGNNVQVKIDGEIIDLNVVMSETGFCSIIHNGKSYNSECVNTSEGKYIITANFRRYEVELQNPRKKYLRTGNGADDEVQDSIKAPMPGKIVEVFVKAGDSVKKGDPLLVIEAMKMQSTYTASQDATVKSVEVEEGDAVLGNQLLISFKHDNEQMQMNTYEILEERNERALKGGGEKAVAKQKVAGKHTARERIDILLDDSTFVETDRFVLHDCHNYGMEAKRYDGDGVITGYGKIDGRLVYVYAYDFTVNGGSLGKANASKIVKLQKMALKTGAPIIALNDSGGARIQEGVNALSGYSEIFYQNVKASGVIPQISAIMGPCAGGACYSPALTDFILMVNETSYMFVTGPDVVKTVTHEELTKAELGGANTHSARSGVAHLVGRDEEEALMMIRELLSFIPSNNMEDGVITSSYDSGPRECPKLMTLIPDNPNIPYDMKELIEEVVDEHYFFEIMGNFAQNILIGFARIGGRPVGIVANQPKCLAGVLDIDASDKAARFIRFCDCFDIPIVTFEDVPGFLPGQQQEHGGIIRHGAKIMYAYAEATVPKITLITRKAYGGAYIVMSSKETGCDVNLAYPNAEIAVMGAEGAVNILYRKAGESERAEAKKEYEALFSNPYRAAEKGYIDGIILPKDTRTAMMQALDMTQNKAETNPPKKHGNMPL